MKSIRTIEDLNNSTEEEINEVIRKISIGKPTYVQIGKDATRDGLTLTEYHEHLDTRHKRATECESCFGRGTVLPYERSVGTIHASSAHQCVRKLYYDVVGELRPKMIIDAKLAITFQIGHAIHGLLQTAMRNMYGDMFKEEVKIDLPDAFVYGSSVDGVIDLGFARVVLEIKTIGKEFVKLRGPKPEHIVQANSVYATATDAPFVCTLYVNKYYPHDFKEYIRPYDNGATAEWYKRKVDKVADALTDGKPPTPDVALYKCKDCSYSETCSIGKNTTGTKKYNTRLTARPKR